MITDPYEGFAERYDWMTQKNPAREDFFRRLFTKHGVSTVLDCACGTGRDLIMFHALGCEVAGSDLSEAMLAQARKNLTEASLNISLQQADYRELEQHYEARFDAVVCLSNSINEPLADAETLRALRSMRAVLRPDGILVFDQGQTDASIRNPPKFAPIANNRDFSRLFTMAYTQDVMTVSIFDFIHAQDRCDFKQASVNVRIRLRDGWERILREAEFKQVEYFGDWDLATYNKESSRRLIGVAGK